MKEAIKKIWYDIKPEKWRELVMSFSGRVQSALKAQGRSCAKY
jgi:hypothetical protein